MIAHVVLFTPKPDLTLEQRRSFATIVVSTIGGVPSVRRAIVGRAIRLDPGYIRNLGDKTYEFAAVLEFDDRAGLASYLNDASHSALGVLFWQSCDDTLITEVEFVHPGDDRAADFLLNEIE